MEKNNQLQLCSYEQALSLKELGFNYCCYTRYISEVQTDTALVPYNWNTDIAKERFPATCCSAPTAAHALMWMREEKDVVCGIHPCVHYLGDKSYVGSIAIAGYAYNTERLSDYNKVESALLDKCIELLKKKGGEK
jgi:hypothetical protein